MNISRWLCSIVLAAVTCSVFAAAPSRIEIKYRVSMGAMDVGEGSDVFVHDGKKYSIVSESKTTGMAGVL